MRKLLLPLAALGVLSIQAQAQAPQHRLKTGYLAFHYTAEVLPGQLDAFKQVAAKVVAAVSQEPGTLVYEWSLRPDQTTFDVLELYQSSEAVIAHINHVLPELGKDLGQVQKEISFAAYGQPTEEAKKALAPLNPVYSTPVTGFIR